MSHESFESHTCLCEVLLIRSCSQMQTRPRVSDMVILSVEIGGQRSQATHRADTLNKAAGESPSSWKLCVSPAHTH